jgi:hypothetical protein
MTPCYKEKTEIREVDAPLSSNDFRLGRLDGFAAFGLTGGLSAVCGNAIPLGQGALSTRTRCLNFVDRRFH